ncbi:MAG: hypothetical protein JWP12_1168 [Bacteroidetes bacterium]|nr:hypothetical protein [Bacteroidota bacterium]
MDFGRLPSIDHVDFTMPPDNIHTSTILNSSRVASPAIYIGCPVWADKGFVGKIYPEDASEKNFLKYYAAQFNCIELNATHYKIPSPAMTQRWMNMTTPGFKFSPKVPQVISHAQNLGGMLGLMDEFLEAIAAFGKQLGTTFMQLPPHFGSNRLNELISFLGNIPHPLKLAIELRHESWFSNATAFNELSNFLMECNHSLVITDVAGRRDVLHQRLTNKTTLIRFVANNLHPTDFNRLNDWAERSASWINEGLEEFYFFIHTPDKSLCPELANYFIAKLNTIAGMRLPLVTIKQKNIQGDLFS